MSTSTPAPAGERLAKVMARAGVCSRREAEAWITAGRVSINGETVKSPAVNVTEADVIVVDGKPLAQREATQAWIYHKPAGLMVTEKDPEGRPTVFEQFETLGLPRVLTVGRLDFSTEGLLILTNDGGVKRTLELPATGWVRRYRVRAFGKVTQAQLDGLAKGITVDGVDYGPIEATLDSEKGSNVWLTLGLREGKNREVRNVLGALGLEVNRLIRISYGPFQLGDLPEGAVEKIKTRVLKDQLGKRLAEASGADFAGSEEGGNAPRRRTPEKPPSRSPERDRYTGLRRRPERENRERPAEPPRTVHFDDGRPAESFTPTPPRRGKDDARPERGARPDRPPRRDGDKPFGDRPPRRDGDKPFAKGPRREGGKPFGDRPPRREGDKPFAKGPRREAPAGGRPPRPEGDRPFAKGPRRDAERPAGARPPRREGEKTFAKGPRRDGDRPFTDRPPRREGDKPFGAAGKGPARGGKPGAARPAGGKPYAGKAGSGKPFAGKPFAGKPGGARADARPAAGGPGAGRSGGRPEGKPAGRPGTKRPYTGAPGSTPRSGGPRDGRAPGGKTPGGKAPGSKAPGGPGASGRKPSGRKPSGGR